MGTPGETVFISESKPEAAITSKIIEDPGNATKTAVSEVGDVSETSLNVTGGQSLCESNTSKESDGLTTKKGKKKARHTKKGYVHPKEVTERNTIRRIHHPAGKFKQCRKRTQSFPGISKFFLPYKRPRKDAFIPPTKFLLGGNISDPLNLNSLQDEDINRAMNAITPESSPLPTPPRHKAKIDVIIPPNIHDPLNLMEPLDNDEYEKRLQMQQLRKPRNRPKLRRRTTEAAPMPPAEAAVDEKKEEAIIKEPMLPEASTFSATNKSRKRSCSETENSSQKGKDCKKIRRMDSLDKIVSPVVPQPGAWMRARPQPRAPQTERPPTSPHRTKPQTENEGEPKLPNFHAKNTKYQFGNYDRYYGYRNLNAMMDVRLQVFDMHKDLFQNKDVLDIGCNVGHISIAAAKTLGARSVLGIDIDPTLIGRARKNLRSFIPVPSEPKGEDDAKHKDNCTENKTGECSTQDLKDEDKKPAPVQGRKVKKPRKNRKAAKVEAGQCYFPMSMALLYGPLAEPPAASTQPPPFPNNVTFKQGNYVPREELAVGSGAEAAQFDLILCLSTTKWLHLNWGDAGLKRAFRRMFNDLRPGGKLVLEAQNWASYKKKKRLTPTIFENFNSIEMFPKKFSEYLLSPEVGFSKCCTLGVPQHASKGFRRPIQLYVKGDFTPSKACWSDAYAPSSHHRPETVEARRTVYAPVAPAYRPSDSAPSCGAATPYSPNLDCCADDSPFYNPRSDSYAPSYLPPRPTVYATLPSPASPASPGAAHSPGEAEAGAEPARVYPPTPNYRAVDD